MSHLGYYQRIGLEAEQWLAELLTAQGHQVSLVSDFFAEIDLLLYADVPLPIEVKLARQTFRRVKGKRYARWQFNIGRLPQNVESIVCLIADINGERFTYVVPSWYLWDRQQVQLTSHPVKYRGWLFEFLERWQTIDEVLAARRRYASMQLPLFI